MYSSPSTVAPSARLLSQDGWGLMELMTVVAVIGVLAGIAITTSRGAKKSGLNGEAKTAVTQAMTVGAKFASQREGKYWGDSRYPAVPPAPPFTVYEPLNAKQLNEQDNSFRNDTPTPTSGPGKNADPWAIHIVVGATQQTATFCSASKGSKVYCIRRQSITGETLYRVGTAGQSLATVATYNPPSDPNWSKGAFK